MKLYKTSKVVLSITDNAGPFLNGLTANSLDKNGNAFLNIHGKIVATFDQLRAGEDRFLVLVESPFVEQVLRHTERYARLSKTGIQPESLRVYFDLDGSYPPEPDEFVVPQKSGKLVITTRDLPANVGEEEFKLFRLRSCIPVHGVDYMDEFLLNVSEVDHVSFTKGCFLGQEPVAKVHNRSRPTWKLVARFADECSDDEKVKMTSRTIDPETGRTWGFVFVKND